jgi:hypothetical protein
MFAIVNDRDEIVAEFDEYNNIRELNDNERILETNISVPVGMLSQVVRVYNDKLVPKLVIEILPNKRIIQADGVDEIELTVELLDRQPDEIVDSVILDIEGAKIPVKINNDKGSVKFSTTNKGVFIIKADREDVICLKRMIESK